MQKSCKLFVLSFCNYFTFDFKQLIRAGKIRRPILMKPVTQFIGNPLHNWVDRYEKANIRSSPVGPDWLPPDLKEVPKSEAYKIKPNPPV
jgi:hypothetical protein